jgi:hypothetical protein
LFQQVLDAYTPALRSATPSDTALLLVTVARLQHVSSYSWLQGVLDHCQDNMMAFDGQVGPLPAASRLSTTTSRRSNQHLPAHRLPHSA